MSAAPQAVRNPHVTGRDGKLRRMKNPTNHIVLLMDQARRLDLEACCELQAGHHVAAERLAHRAAELRGQGA